MGKVFTSQEIVEGRVPQEGAHTEAGHFLLDTMWLRYLEQFDDAEYSAAFTAFDGSMIYGSVAQDSANRRSDLDVLVTYSVDVGAPDIVIEGYRSLFQEVENIWHVPIESNIWHIGSFMNGVHTIDAAFLEHLQSVEKSWLVGNPLEFLTIKEPDYTDIFNRYYAHKVRSFTKALSDTTDIVNPHHLQRALELPAALGRKALSTLAQIDGTVTSPGNLTKNKVNQQVAALTAEWPRITELLEDLRTIDDEYSALLEKTVEGHYAPDEYERRVNALYRPALAGALRLTSALGDFVVTQLKTK